MDHVQEVDVDQLLVREGAWAETAKSEEWEIALDDFASGREVCCKRGSAVAILFERREKLGDVALYALMWSWQRLIVEEVDRLGYGLWKHWKTEGA